MEKDHWTSTDKKCLPYTRWPTAGPASGHPKAAVICVHGLSGAASDFWPAGEMLEKDGCVAYGMELRGMGNDPDKSSRGDVRSRQRWTDDLMAFTAAVRSRHPGVPVFWFGESLGALIVMHSVALLDNAQPMPAGVILTSPVIGFRRELPWWKYCPLRLLMQLLPWKRISLESLGEDEVKVTNRTTHKQQMEKTPHYVEFFTLRLFRVVEKMVRESHRAAQALHVPVLMLYTPNDVFNTAEQLEDFFQQVGCGDKTKVLYPKSYHLILHDVDRPNALREIKAWLDAHCTGQLGSPAK
ncbi:MAG: alpha/beta fold hydrolase [Verrucomicrobiales bacterium]|nr:alpha/beta fold hydrolase [Verrucomicrobiales bacterium]